MGYDINGYIGNDRLDYDRVHQGNGFKKRIKAGERVLDIMSEYELAIVNTIFQCWALMS